MEGSTIRIRVVVEIDVNEAAWTTAYGVEGRDAIRRDVAAYVDDRVIEATPTREGLWELARAGRVSTVRSAR